MSTLTFKFILNETKRGDSTRLVLLRITYQRRYKYLATGVYVGEKYFNPAGTYERTNWIRSTHGQSVSYNLILKAWLDRAEQVRLKLIQIGQPFTVDEVRRRMDYDESDIE